MPTGPNESTTAEEITQPIAMQQEPGEASQLLRREDIAGAVSVVPPKGVGDHGLEHELLARANLLRIRKQYAEATTLCEDALRRWPRSVEANALLGDIHLDEGRVDDAILRYCRVLESDPRNASGRAKLTQLVGMKRQQLSGRVPGIALPPLRADRLFRAGTLAIATVMLLTIVVAPTIIRRREQPASNLLLDRGKDIMVKPVYLVPVAPPAPPAPVQPNTPAPTPPPEPMMLRAPLDQGIVDVMKPDTALLGQGVQVVDAETDPRAGRVTVTYLYRQAAGDLDAHSQILRGALLLAQSLAAHPEARSATTLTLRCLLLSSPPMGIGSPAPVSGQIVASTPLAFVADLPRAQIPPASFLQMPHSSEELAVPFSDVWWSDGSGAQH